jgi:hypothetical protein
VHAAEDEEAERRSQDRLPRQGPLRSAPPGDQAVDDDEEDEYGEVVEEADEEVRSRRESGGARRREEPGVRAFQEFQDFVQEAASWQSIWLLQLVL